LPQLAGTRSTLHERDLFQARDLQPLAVLDGAHKIGRFQQPSHASPCRARRNRRPRIRDMQLAGLEVKPVEIGDFQFAPRRGFSERACLTA